MIEWGRDPIYDELKESLTRLKIEAVLFDLDDTLIDTSGIFRMCQKEYVRRVVEETGVDQSELARILDEENNKSYLTMGVSPLRWYSTVSRIIENYPEHEVSLSNNLPILLMIYQLEPKMRGGSRTVLDTLQKSETKMGLVTHANVDWTYRKMDMLGLWNYFDVTKIVHEDDRKQSVHWQEAMDGLGVDARNCLVVGDSLNSDVCAAADLGARTVWIPTRWVVNKAGTVPQETVQIEKITDLLAALGGLR